MRKIWMMSLKNKIKNIKICSKRNAPRKNGLGKMPPGKLSWGKLSPPPGKSPPRKITPPSPMKFFLGIFSYLKIFLMKSFIHKIYLFSFNYFFCYKFFYSICLHYFFQSVYFWFSGMEYNVYHTYMLDQQCWASLPGYTLFL